MTAIVVNPGYRWYAMKHSSGELLSLKGAVIIHNNPHEYEFLIVGCQGTVGLKGSHPQEVANHLQRRVMLLKDHPDLSWVRWPINREDFWDHQFRVYSEKETAEVRRRQWLS